MKRGDVHWADFVPRSGSERMGWRSIIVVPISTSASQAGRGPAVVEITGAAAGLPKTSLAVCHQATTLDRAKLSKRIGALSPELLTQLEGGLKAALDLD